MPLPRLDWTLIGALFLALPMVSHADERQSWEVLHLAQLAESDGDVTGAIRIYRHMVRGLPADDPYRAEALYWLAHALWRSGQTREARNTLREGVRTGSCVARCHDLLGRIELDAYSVTKIPIRWTFDTPEHSIFHSWSYRDKGTIKIGRPPGSQEDALIWTTFIDARKVDELVVGFAAPNPAPREVRVQLQSSAVEAWIRVLADDETGRTFTLGPIGQPVPIDRPVTVRVALDEMIASDGSGARLDPSRLSRLRLVDASGMDGNAAGDNALFLYSFEAVP